MAARAKPSGIVPDQKDVKAPVDSSVPEQEQADNEKAESLQASSEQEPEVDENDLEELEGKKVPYSRFKEVNEKAKTIEAQKKELERKYQEDLRRAVEDAEIRTRTLIQKQVDEAAHNETADPYEREINKQKQETAALRQELQALKGQTAHQQLVATIKNLEGKYEDVDTTAILAKALYLKKTDPESIEEMMHEAYTKQLDTAKRQVQKIIENKKQRAKAAMPTREGGIKLKESDRPKTMKEAGEKLKALWLSRS